jgi:YfiR/HmsC-like
VALLRTTQLALCAALALLLLRAARGAETPGEYQVKAVFVFNFSRFVEWPPQAFSAPDQPFAICILGNDPFGPRLDEAVRGEQINQHPLLIRRLRSVREADNCQILYIDRSEAGELHQILSALDHRSTLTVSELSDAAERGGMIQFMTENNRIRLRINVESARAAGLTISSKLLRPADIVATSDGGVR